MKNRCIFRSGRVWVDHILTMKQIYEKKGHFFNFIELQQAKQDQHGSSVASDNENWHWWKTVERNQKNYFDSETCVRINEARVNDLSNIRLIVESGKDVLGLHGYLNCIWIL